MAKADLLAATLRSGSSRDRAELLPNLLARIDLREESTNLTINPVRLSTTLGLTNACDSTAPIVLSMPAVRVRRGHQIRLIIPGPQALNVVPTSRDTRLIALLAEGHEARQLLLASPDQSIASIAAAQGRCRTRLGKLAALGCLAPDIVTAIVEGRQPATLTARALQAIDLPLAWPDQRTLLGFS